MPITARRLLLGCALVLGLTACGADPGRPTPGPTAPEQPTWAAQAGTDAHGRWADLTIGTTTQRFRYIAPSTFTMGCPKAEDDFDAAPHQVTLTRGYWLADSECTQALWLAVMGDAPSNFTGDPRLPVEQVTWGETTRFMTALSALGKAPCRMPTEAEWECACRAGTATPFSFGATITTDQVNYHGLHPYVAGAPLGVNRQRTLPVKSLPPNAWGLYDMHGNVSEWCSDWYAFYPPGPASDPQGPTAPEGDPEHPFRGGCFDNHAANCRSASRMSRGPDYRGWNVGVRVLIADAPPGAR